MNIYNEFIGLCVFDELDACKNFYSANPGINISVCDDYLFTITCLYNRIHVVKWLLIIKPTINIAVHDNVILRTLKDQHDHMQIAYLLAHYIPYYNVEENAGYYKNIAAISDVFGLWDLA